MCLYVYVVWESSNECRLMLEKWEVWYPIPYQSRSHHHFKQKQRVIYD